MHIVNVGVASLMTISLSRASRSTVDDMTNPGGGRMRVYSQVSRSTVTPDGRFVSESRMTRTVNGITELVWKFKDASICPLLRLEFAYADAHCLTQGNEYATYTYPDGRETAHCQRA